jgi:hypothetical protein
MFSGDYYMRKATLLFVLIITAGLLHSQVGGSYTYAFLDMPSTARITAMKTALLHIPFTKKT